MSSNFGEVQLSEKELKVKSMKEMKEKLKLNIGSRKCLGFIKEMKKASSISDEEI